MVDKYRQEAITYNYILFLIALESDTQSDSVNIKAIYLSTNLSFI